MWSVLFLVLEKNPEKAEAIGQGLQDLGTNQTDRYNCNIKRQADDETRGLNANHEQESVQLYDDFTVHAEDDHAAFPKLFCE